MSIYVKDDKFGPAVADLERVLKSGKNIVAVAGLVKTTIVSRSLASKSLRGTRFPDYTPTYEKWKTAKGYPARPTLSLTNQMFADIQINVVTPHLAYLFFGSRLSEAKAHRHHTGKYPFFGILESEHKNLHVAILKHLKQIEAFHLAEATA